MFTISVGPTCTGWILGGLTLSWSRLRRIMSFGICVFMWKINRRFGAVYCSHSPPRRRRQQILSKSEWIPTGRRGVQSQNSVFFRWELLAAFPDLVCCNHPTVADALCIAVWMWNATFYLRSCRQCPCCSWIYQDNQPNYLLFTVRNWANLEKIISENKSYETGNLIYCTNEISPSNYHANVRPTANERSAMQYTFIHSSLITGAASCGAVQGWRMSVRPIVWEMKA